MITDARVLQPEFVPQDVRHRGTEVSHLTDTLHPILEETGHPQPSFLFGPSGTGKTCITRYTVEKLREELVERGHISNLPNDQQRTRGLLVHTLSGLFLVGISVLSLEILKFVYYRDGIHPRGQAPRHSACFLCRHGQLDMYSDGNFEYTIDGVTVTTSSPDTEYTDVKLGFHSWDDAIYIDNVNLRRSKKQLKHAKF